MSCLGVEHVSKTFYRRTARGVESIHAVDDVSFRLHEGQSLGIIGTSGCGKTTLLNIILGLVQPDAGSVHKHAPVGIVGQDPYASLCPTMTVERLVAEPLIFLGRERSYAACMPSVERVLTFVKLPRDVFGGRLPSQLSGGERQRVGIARALIVDPVLLLLDEPTSMLDQEVKDGVASVIRSVADTRKTAFLMVTHDVELAARICDRILVMDKGRIIEENTADGILAEPQSELARDLVRISTDVGAYWREKYENR